MSAPSSTSGAPPAEGVLFNPALAGQETLVLPSRRRVPPGPVGGGAGVEAPVAPAVAIGADVAG